MRVLLAESDTHAADRAHDRLRDAGYQVVRCTEPFARAFPCRGLVDAGCPLDEGVDVAVTVRELPHPEPQLAETGVICARSRSVPVVVAGELADDPFADIRTEGVAIHDVVAAVGRAAEAPLPAHAAAVLAELRRHIGAATADVDVRRAGRGLQVTLTLGPEIDGTTASMLAVRAAGIVRKRDRWATVVDVSVVRS